MTRMQMTTRRLMTAYLISIVLLMCGCGKVRYPNYYTLAVAPTKQPALNVAHQSEPWPSAVSILLGTYARDGSSIGKLLKKWASTTITGGLQIRGLWLLPG